MNRVKQLIQELAEGKFFLHQPQFKQSKTSPYAKLPHIVCRKLSEKETGDSWYISMAAFSELDEAKHYLKLAREKFVDDELRRCGHDLQGVPVDGVDSAVGTS